MSADAGSTVAIHRILVAVDGSEHSLAALEAATELAARLQAELEALFVEDDDLLRLADLPFARVVSLTLRQAERVDREGMERQLRLQAERMRRSVEERAAARGVHAHFRAVRGAVAAEVTAAAEEADLVSVGRAGHGRVQQTHGSTLQAVLAAGRPVLVAERHTHAGEGVLAVYDGSPAGARALEMGAELAQAGGSELHVLALGASAGEAEALAARIQARLDVWGISHRLHYSWAEPQRATLSALRHVRPALLVVGGELGELVVEATSRPVLVVP
jgi:nucleotide-binding universal stress UspA family protein